MKTNKKFPLSMVGEQYQIWVHLQNLTAHYGKEQVKEVVQYALLLDLQKRKQQKAI